MKKIALASLLLSSIAVNATTITVEGVGSSREAAKQDAFRTAIENVCGTMVLSDRKHVNNTTTLNKVVTYSGCVVKSYKILAFANNHITMTVDVEKNNTVGQRLQPESQNTFNVDQQKLKAQYDTEEEKNTHAVSLVKQVLRDYPYTSFNLETENTTIDPDAIKIEYTVSWKSEFLDSFMETMKSMDNGNGWKDSCEDNGINDKLGVEPDKRKFLWFYGFNLYCIPSAANTTINETLTKHDVFVEVTGFDEDENLILNTCVRVGAIGRDYIDTSENRLMFNTANKEDILLLLGGTKIHNESPWIVVKYPTYHIHDIHTKIVLEKDCASVTR